MTTTLEPPRVVEVVTPDAVDARIAVAREELAALETHLVTLRDEADALEALVREPFDAEAHEFVAVRLRRFLDELRAEANAEIDTLLGTADARVQRHRPVVSFAHLVTVEEPALPAIPALPVEAPPPVTAPARPLADPVIAPAPAAAPAPGATPLDSFDAPPTSDVFAELAALSMPEPTTGLETEFWADVDQQAPGRHLLRTVRAVGLQAAAVVMVLAAVLVRVG